MQVQSALNAGLQGFQNATNDAVQAASDIAKQTATTSSANVATTTASEAAPSQSVDATASITDSIVKLNAATNNAEASAKVVASADETLGTIIDTRV